MKTYVFDTSIEPLLSRLPSMFAYIEFKEDWTTELHPAIDSYNGSYGKVVENIAVPCGVNLCVYTETDTWPEVYQWNTLNTFSVDENVEDSYTINASEYIRQVKSYAYTQTEFDASTTYEEVDPLPNEVNSDSPDHIKVPQRDKVGNYILDCDSEKIYDYFDKTIEYIYYKKTCLVEEGETYTYRTLIDYYYTYKDVIPNDNSFIMFMEAGIGKVKTDKQRLRLDNEEEYPNVPEYVYLGDVKRLLGVYKKYHRICEFYRTHYLNFDKQDAKLEKKCLYYKSIGGDAFMKYLEKLSEKANEVASEYLCYANNRSHDVEISLNIPISQSKNDLGYLSCYMNEFVAGQQYYHGELLTYNGITYICILNRYLVGGNNYEYVLCNDKLYGLSGTSYIEISFGMAQGTEVPNSLYNNKNFIYFNGSFYKWNGNAAQYDILDVTEYCTGLWDDNLEINTFDSQHFIPLTEYIKSNAGSLGLPQKVILNDKDVWYSQDNPYGERFKIFISVPTLPQEFIYENIKYGNTFYKWDETSGSYINDPNYAQTYTIKGRTDSQLASLRIYQQFMNENNEIEEPSPSEDWLYYYKVGNFVADGNIAWDSAGNIKRFDGVQTPSIGGDDYGLMAYGTIITDIQCDVNEKTLTFTYVVNAHLKAELADIRQNDDNQEVRTYRSFAIDETDTHGVEYVETYHYIDIAIDDLVNNGDFDDFVHGRDIPNYFLKYGYKRFVFLTTNVTGTITMNGYEFEYPYILSSFTEETENSLDYIYQPLFKKDYFVGYAYEPSVESNVDIRRGNGSCYERHFRLQEVKSVEDIENLANGGFFKMSDLDIFNGSISNFRLK